MSVMDNMMRQHRWALDERRRFLTELESLALRLRRDAQRLHQEIAEESGAISREDRVHEAPSARVWCVTSRHPTR